jgi:transposase
MERESRETWSKRIERWKDSGLTAKEYAAEVGINAHSLTWWRWRLSATPKTKTESRPRRVSARASRHAATPVTFVELPAAGAEPLEIVLPSTLRIRVPSGFDAKALKELLEILDARR